MEKLQANIQLMDNYIKEYNLNIKERIPENLDLELGCSITFEVVKIESNEKEKIGQVDMTYDIKLIENETELGTIHLLMQALFTGDIELSDEKFEEMLKYNGAPILSQIIRAYITANTALSDMPTIKFPVMNFYKFFKQADKQKKS